MNNLDNGPHVNRNPVILNVPVDRININGDPGGNAQDLNQHPLPRQQPVNIAIQIQQPAEINDIVPPEFVPQGVPDLDLRRAADNLPVAAPQHVPDEGNVGAEVPLPLPRQEDLGMVAHNQPQPARNRRRANRDNGGGNVENRDDGPRVAPANQPQEEGLPPPVARRPRQRNGNNNRRPRQRGARRPRGAANAAQIGEAVANLNAQVEGAMDAARELAADNREAARMEDGRLVDRFRDGERISTEELVKVAKHIEAQEKATKALDKLRNLELTRRATEVVPSNVSTNYLERHNLEPFGGVNVKVISKPYEGKRAGFDGPETLALLALAGIISGLISYFFTWLGLVSFIVTYSLALGCILWKLSRPGVFLMHRKKRYQILNAHDGVQLVDRRFAAWRASEAAYSPKNAFAVYDAEFPYDHRFVKSKWRITLKGLVKTWYYKDGDGRLGDVGYFRVGLGNYDYVWFPTLLVKDHTALISGEMFRNLCNPKLTAPQLANKVILDHLEKAAGTMTTINVAADDEMREQIITATIDLALMHADSKKYGATGALRKAFLTADASF